jgi:deoxyhypusine synthase
VKSILSMSFFKRCRARLLAEELWGKFVPHEEGGMFAEVYADATIAWPILVKAVMQRIGG